MTDSNHVQDVLDNRAKVRMDTDINEFLSVLNTLFSGFNLSSDESRIYIQDVGGGNKPYRELDLHALRTHLKKSFFNQRTDSYRKSEAKAFFQRIESMNSQFAELSEYVETHDHE